MLKNILTLSLLFLATPVLSHTKEEWRSRTIYQLLTDRFARTDGSSAACSDLHAYCGGTWKGIENQLDYIKNLGFDAIWISPIPENKGNDYHGYAGLNWYNVNPKFGTSADLKSMVDAAHAKGIWIMLDVVANHVAAIDTDYAQVTPFNDASYYHSKCDINDWNNQAQVENCRLSNLPDLDQSNSFVRSFLKEWVHDQITTYGFDGIRVDTTPEVPKDFWLEYAAAAGVYQIGEVFNGDIGYVSSYQGNALDATLNYPLYFTLKDVFEYKQSMFNIRSVLQSEASAFKDTSVLGTFIDNHDNARFLNLNPSVNLLKSAVTYTLFGSGIPIVYYGTEQAFKGGNDPENREPLWTNMNTNSDMYKYIQTLNSVRKAYSVWNEEHIERWCDDSFYAFTRGNVLVALTNDDSGAQQFRQIAYHPYTVGQKLCNQLFSGDCVVVAADNTIGVYLDHGEAKVFIPVSSAIQEEESIQQFLQ